VRICAWQRAQALSFLLLLLSLADAPHPLWDAGAHLCWQRAQALSFLLLLFSLADAPHPLWEAGAHLCMVAWSLKNLHDCMACELKELELRESAAIASYTHLHSYTMHDETQGRRSSMTEYPHPPNMEIIRASDPRTGAPTNQSPVWACDLL